jgi:hypothetical protein
VAKRIALCVGPRQYYRPTAVRFSYNFPIVLGVYFFTGNVDYALLNFMADWFPLESREKLSANEREVTREQLEELGLPDRGCLVM